MEDITALETLFQLIGNYGGLVTLSAIAVVFIFKNTILSSDKDRLKTIEENTKLILEAQNLKCQRSCDENACRQLLHMYLMASSASFVHRINQLISRAKYTDFDSTYKEVLEIAKLIYSRNLPYPDNILFDGKSTISYIDLDSFYAELSSITSDWIISDVRHNNLKLMDSLDTLNEKTLNSAFI